MFQRFTKVFIAIILVLSFSMLDSASAATNPKLVASKPLHQNEQVPINSELSFEFNDDIVRYHKEKIKFYKKGVNNKYYEEPLKDVQLSGKTVKLIPENKLVFNKEYKIEVGGYAFELKNGYYPSSIYRTFKTNYMSFYELMVVDTAKLAELLRTYSNRQVIVSAPERYINEIKVDHKKQGKVENDPSQSVTDSLTNIDILLKNDNLYKIKVQIVSNGKVLRTDYAKKYTESGKTIFSVSYGNLPVGFDVKITVLDNNLYIMDEIFMKVVSGDKLFTQMNEKYSYKTAGNSYSLFDLVTNEALFNSLLLENNINKIMVQVNR